MSLIYKIMVVTYGQTTSVQPVINVIDFLSREEAEIAAEKLEYTYNRTRVSGQIIKLYE